MKVLFLSVLSSIVLSVQGQGSGCSQYCDACSELADIAKITCDPARGTCSIVKGESSTEENLDDLLGGITSIDADICRQKCKEQVEREALPANQCKFYRWEEGHQKDKKSTCSLQTTCPGPTSWCGTSACKSGQLGCSNDCKQVTPCSLTKTEWDHNKFHVICTDTEGDVNIYSPDIANREINDGTICSTIRMCDEWSDVPEGPYYRKLAIVCDGIGGEGVGNEGGQWKIMEKTGSNAVSEAMKGDGTQIVEQECKSKCADLGPLTHIDYDWVDLICDATLEDKTLKDPNSCIMLCDNHLKMTIDCDYKENGEKKWQNGHGVVLTDASITC